jgi:fatty acid desaturase
MAPSVLASFFYIAGIGLCWTGAVGGDWARLTLGWILTIHGSRKLQLNLAHACAHGTVSGDEVTDEVIGRIIQFAVLGTAFEVYKTGHVTLHHNWIVLATGDDPTTQSQAKADIVPGVPKQALYRRLFGPAFHRAFICAFSWIAPGRTWRTQERIAWRLSQPESR